MNEAKKCPKCSREMAKGSNENLARNFACTRSEPKPGDPVVGVQSYCCKNCGYIEFYKERKKGRSEL